MLIDEILDNLWNKTVNYKGVRVNLLGIPRFKKYPEGSVRSTIYRLRTKGFIEQDGKYYYLTKLGHSYIASSKKLKHFNNTFKKEAPKTLMVMFDIPEEQKAEREWFRFHLRKFGYIMIQKSVWVGPPPLPKEFLVYVKKIKLNNHIKTFKLAKAYTK